MKQTKRPTPRATDKRLSGALPFAISTLILGASMSACSFENTTSWKEEVLLHDGRKIIVERSTTRNPFGLREIGQSAPISEQTLSFTVPGMSQRITWKSDFGRTTQDNLDLLALDIVGGTPYVVTYPGFCHAFNRWGRPNPPYVYFKFDGRAWQRIANGELPREIRQANVVIGGYGSDEKGRLRGLGIDEAKTRPYLTVEVVARFNNDMSGDPESQRMRVFVREPVQGGGMHCMAPTFNSPKAPDLIPPDIQAEGTK
ncbi:MAG: hypothetical protein U1E84_05325 [Rhodoferax sp.]